MAYYVNNKTYTDHPLMDEICYNCKLILKSIVIKNDILAMQKETNNSVDNAEMYFLMHDNGYIDFNTFNFTKEIYTAYGYSESQIKRFLEDKYAIPENDRITLTKFANNYFKANFEEENDYYRMLMGLPPFDTGEQYYIWLVSSDIPAKYTAQVMLDKPLHEQPTELLNLLYENGTIDKLRETYIGSNYSYMLYLGDKAIDLYYARKASKWDILYMPNVYYLVENKFTDFYKINRETYMTRSYQEFFSQSGEYYDQMMILIVLAETFANMITDTPQWYIRRDIFDLRSCKYFLESSGVEYFKIIPLKYQIRIVKNLNKLIKYKSSNQNAEDILDIFDVPNTKIYKYWLYKKRDPEEDCGYSLEFISSDYTESYDGYIKDSKYRTLYDDITTQDKYWDGEDTHELVKDNIMDQEFTIQGTKYMSIEYQVSMKDWLYQTEYMLGLILDSNLYKGLSDIKIAIPTIDDIATFKISDLFLFLAILSNSYYRDNLNTDETTIRVPNTDQGKTPTVNEKYYSWMKKYMPEMFVQKNGRIHGFNSTLNKNTFIKTLEKRHSHLRFGMPNEIGENGLTDSEYKIRADKWLNELGVTEFVVPGTSINTIDDLMGVYDIDTKVYNNIRTAIIDASNEDDKKYLEYIYQELFTRPFDTELYTKVKSGKIITYKDLIQLLQERDYILYDVFMSIMNETNLESKQDYMRSIMNDTVDTLEYYLSGDGLEYLYSFVSINSFGNIVKYIYLMLNFFKSYKVYFLDPYYTLQSDDELENSVKPIDIINEYKIINYKWDKSHVDDHISGINTIRELSDPGEYDRMFEVADIYAHYDPDPLMDLDINGITAETGEKEETTDIDGGSADPSETAPYLMLNAGHSYLGLVDMNDMNGGIADEKYKEYYSINGGEAYDPNTLKADAMGSQMFNFVIDGGAASKSEFINNSMHLKLIGTELQGNVIISNKYQNCIDIKEDGLYVAGDAFASASAFERLVATIDNIIGKIKTESGTALEDLMVVSDKDARYARIYSIIDSIVGNMEYTIDMISNDKLANIIYKYINEIINIFYTNYNTEIKNNPYAWEELD